MSEAIKSQSFMTRNLISIIQTADKKWYEIFMSQSFMTRNLISIMGNAAEVANGSPFESQSFMTRNLISIIFLPKVIHSMPSCLNPL